MAVQPKKKGTKRVAGNIPEDDARALELSAQENRRSIAAELGLAVEHWLKKNGRRP